MKNTIAKVTACAVLATSLLATPTLQADAALLSKSDSSTQKVIVINKKELRRELRKDILRHHGASEEAIEQLDALGVFDWEISDIGAVDVSTWDQVTVILENNNIDIDIVINFITINKKG